MIESSKKRFLQDKSRSTAWNDLVVSAIFVDATDSAMLEFCLQQKVYGGVYEAQSAAHRLEGAREFLRVLTNIGRDIKMPERKQDAPLEYTDQSIPGHLET